MNGRKTYVPPKGLVKKPGATPIQKRISWSQGLKNNDIINILQCKLMEARAPSPQRTEVDLLPELVHEIKHRLTEYDRMIGDLPKAKQKNYDNFDDGDEEEDQD